MERKLTPKNRGFTLVEMLLTLVLLTSVLLMATRAYSLFAQRWDGQLGCFQQTANNARALLLVKRAVNAIVPYVVHDAKGQGKLYFEGNLNGFVAVASQGAFDPSYPAVIRLQLVIDQGKGYRLEYQEWPMRDNYLLHMQQSIPFSQPLVLQTGLVSPRFYYYGVASLLASGQHKPKPQWHDEYNSLARGAMPEQVMLELQSGQKLQFRINDDYKTLGRYNIEFTGA